MQLYIVKLESQTDDEVFYKVGVTKHLDIITRFSYGATKVTDSGLPLRQILELKSSGQKYMPDNPYEIEVVHTVSYKLEGDALIAEHELLKALVQHKYWPSKNFSGRTECFRGENLIDIVKDYMDSSSTKKNQDAPPELIYKLHSTQIKDNDPIKKHLLVLKSCKNAGAI
jgi:hypothetical protein